MRTDAPTPVTCAGLHANADGLAEWPFRSRRHLWSDLNQLEVHELRRPDRYLVRFTFTRGTVVADLRRPWWQKDRLARLAELLRLACTGAPPSATVASLARDVAACGPRDHGRSLAAAAEAGSGPSAWIDLARHHRAILDRTAVVQAVESALALRPDSEDIFRVGAELLAWADAGPVRLEHAGRAWQHRYPESHDARRFCLQLDLGAGEADAPARAEAWLREHPDDTVIAQALTDAHVARGDAPAAAAVWENRGNATDAVTQRRATAARTRADFHARLASGRRARAWGFAFAFVPGVAFLAFSAWQGARQATREAAREVQRAAEIAQEMEASRAKLERTIAETTGLALGTQAELEARATAGDAAAAYTLSEWLFNGNPRLPADPERARAYLEDAAARDHPQAMFKLAQRLEGGDGLPADPARAVDWYERCAARGSIPAAGLAGLRLAEGRGVTKDTVRAIPLLKQAADGGDLSATTRLAWIYERGDGITADPRAAMDLYRAAANKDNLYAIERLVRLLEQRGASPEDLEEVWSWTERGARQGSTTLQLTYARHVMNGRPAAARDRAQAVHWVRDAHTKGSSEGAYLWGRLHLLGWQVEPNVEVAAEAFQSEHGRKHPMALRHLVKMYAFGLAVPRDPHEARTLRDQFAASRPPAAMLQDLDRVLEATTADLDPAPESGKRPQRALWQEPPVYPGDLRRSRVSGSARVQYALDAQGFTRDVTLLEASHPEFGPAAVTAVRQWRFDPEWEGGVAQLGPRETTVRFTPPAGLEP